MSNETLLQGALAVAVPLWIERLQALTFEQRRERAAICMDTVAHKGDIILYRSNKPGETAEAFNRLAEGIACLAFAPGGVTCFGSHWNVGARVHFRRRVPVTFHDLADVIRRVPVALADLPRD